MNPREHMMDLKGKAYLPVAARIVWMRQEHPDWRIATGVEEIAGAAHMRASVMDGDGNLLAMSHKRIRGKGEGRGPAAQFPVETAETGAVGRALALCGYGTLAGDLDEGEDIADAPVDMPTPIAPPDPDPDLEADLDMMSPSDMERHLDSLRAAYRLTEDEDRRKQLMDEAGRVKAVLEELYAHAGQAA